MRSTLPLNERCEGQEQVVTVKVSVPDYKLPVSPHARVRFSAALMTPTPGNGRAVLQVRVETFNQNGHPIGEHVFTYSARDLGMDF